MTPKEYAELLEYVYNNNSWGLNMHNIVHERHRRAIKYMEASFDTRDGRVWKIVFRQIIAASKSESEKIFTIKCPDDITKIYRWLDEEVR